jgi:hypothetical protein
MYLLQALLLGRLWRGEIYTRERRCRVGVIYYLPRVEVVGVGGRRLLLGLV